MPEYINPDTMALQNYGIQGLRALFQPLDATTGTYSTKLIDFGIVENPALTQDKSETNIEHSRNGLRQVAKVLTTKLAESMTFDTANVGDEVIVGLYEGNTALKGVDAKQFVIIRNPGGSVTGRFFLLYPGDPNTDSKLLAIPNTQIAKNSETASDGQNVPKLSFKVNFLTDENYKVPATVLASNDPAPNGLVVLLAASPTAPADLLAVVDELIAAPAAATPAPANP